MRYWPLAASSMLLMASTPAYANTTDWLHSLRDMVSSKALDTLYLGGTGLGAFLLGWLAAKLISQLVFKVLKATTIDNMIMEKLGLDTLFEAREGEPDHQLERVLAQTTYYLLMVVVLIFVIEVLGLSQVADPLRTMVASITAAVPLVLKASLILGGAWVVGKVLEKLVRRFFNRMGVDKRFTELSRTGDEDEDPTPPFSENAGALVFWLSMFIGLAGVFDALNISPLADPLRNALDEVFGVLPALGVAAALLFGGYVASRIARAVVQNLLTTAGFNKLMARVKLDGLFGETSPAGAMGLLTMVFIQLQALIAALNELGLDTLSTPLTDMMSRFWNLLPDLAVAGFIGVLGLSISRIVRGVVERGLRNIGLNQMLERLGLGQFTHHTENLDEPSEVMGLVAQIGVILVAAVQILEHLGLDTWAGYVNGLLSYAVQNILVSLGIVIVGFAVGKYLRGLVASQFADGDVDGPARWMGEMARAVVLVFAFTAAIRHLDIAEDFVLMSFSLMFGSLCLGAALAFGLGAREIAGEIVRRQYDRALTQLGDNNPDDT